jgi:hypothetical protein
MNPSAKEEQRKRIHVAHVNREIATMKADINKRLTEIVKQPPAWFPKIIWFTLARIFLNL